MKNNKYVLSILDEKKYKKLSEYAKILMRMHAHNELIEKQIINKLIKINIELKNIKNKYRS